MNKNFLVSYFKSDSITAEETLIRLIDVSEDYVKGYIKALGDITNKQIHYQEI